MQMSEAADSGRLWSHFPEITWSKMAPRSNHPEGRNLQLDG
jgi:hypothetical protein